MPPNPLEYEEESEDYNELFGSEPEDDDPLFVDTRVPVRAGPSTTALHRTASPAAEATPAAGPSSERSWPTTDQRIEQLRRLHAHPSLPPEQGVPSLRAFTMRVIRMNSSRIWDVGGMQYNQIAEFLDELPREQLSEIEEAAPHLLKDTDWLWEGFVLQEHSLFHEKCRLRRGEPRTSGWRRMYAKAAVESAERQRVAAERMKQRYAEHDAQRQKKKIVVMDTFVAPQKGRSKSAYSLSTARRGAKAAAAYSAPTKAQAALNKARADSQRARIALTHASGKYVPPPATSKRPRASTSGPTAYTNPYSIPPAAPAEPKVTGPRLPPPRIARPKATAVEAERFPGSHPTEPAARKALPTHIKPTDSPSRDVYRQAEGSSRMREIHKPKTQNFVPDAEKNKPRHLDFFGASAASSTPTKNKVSVSVKKRPVHDTDRGDASKRPRTDTGASSSAAPPSEPPHSAPGKEVSSNASPVPPSSSFTSTPPPNDANAGIRPTGPKRPPPKAEDVLFAKKRKAPFRPRG